eukprot:CAMPEP_0174268938 /NCGR_PEP_ID=MMETSP0439-20130205/39236_1 /TAXON_ID=0 /ORGANISM="Stereomyxa ramosa, Strain Chinc5" /LENGTH=233 /DNA_ID=CAMNT_0015357421 /DNA_START=272 /DNA_END=970 /DNA_ORIENTATION=-
MARKRPTSLFGVDTKKVVSALDKHSSGYNFDLERDRPEQEEDFDAMKAKFIAEAASTDEEKKLDSPHRGQSITPRSELTKGQPSFASFGNMSPRSMAMAHSESEKDLTNTTIIVMVDPETSRKSLIKFQSIEQKQEWLVEIGNTKRFVEILDQNPDENYHDVLTQGFNDKAYKRKSSTKALQRKILTQVTPMIDKKSRQDSSNNLSISGPDGPLRRVDSASKMGVARSASAPQ